jgi:hypothetical protein
MDQKYNKINKNILKGEILIYSRKHYIELISKEFLNNNIIPTEYIDNKLKLDNINKNKNNVEPQPLLIDDSLRLKFIIELLSKECIKGTSQLIANMCDE